MVNSHSNAYVLIFVCVTVVDEKERKNGNDPEKELADSGFHDYRRPLVAYFYALSLYVTNCIIQTLMYS